MKKIVRASKKIESIFIITKIVGYSSMMNIDSLNFSECKVNKLENCQRTKCFFLSFKEETLVAGAIQDSTIVLVRPMDVVPSIRSDSTGASTIVLNAPDDREIFKVCSNKKLINKRKNKMNLLTFFLSRLYTIV